MKIKQVVLICLSLIEILGQVTPQSSVICGFAQFLSFNNDCVQCPTTCSACKSLEKPCQGCTEGFKLTASANQCQKCGLGQLRCEPNRKRCQRYYRLQDNQCKPKCIVSNCLQCSSIIDTKCKACIQGYRLNEQKTSCLRQQQMRVNNQIRNLQQQGDRRGLTPGQLIVNKIDELNLTNQFPPSTLLRLAQQGTTFNDIQALAQNYTDQQRRIFQRYNISLFGTPSGGSASNGGSSSFSSSTSNFGSNSGSSSGGQGTVRTTTTETFQFSSSGRGAGAGTGLNGLNGLNDFGFQNGAQGGSAISTNSGQGSSVFSNNNFGTAGSTGTSNFGTGGISSGGGSTSTSTLNFNNAAGTSTNFASASGNNNFGTGSTSFGPGTTSGTGINNFGAGTGTTSTTTTTTTNFQSGQAGTNTFANNGASNFGPGTTGTGTNFGTGISSNIGGSTTNFGTSSGTGGSVFVPGTSTTTTTINSNTNNDQFIPTITSLTEEQIKSIPGIQGPLMDNSQVIFYRFGSVRYIPAASNSFTGTTTVVNRTTISTGGSTSTAGSSTTTGGISTGGISTGGISTGGISTGGISTGGTGPITIISSQIRDVPLINVNPAPPLPVINNVVRNTTVTTTNISNGNINVGPVSPTPVVFNNTIPNVPVVISNTTTTVIQTTTITNTSGVINGGSGGTTVITSNTTRNNTIVDPTIVLPVIPVVPVVTNTTTTVVTNNTNINTNIALNPDEQCLISRYWNRTLQRCLECSQRCLTCINYAQQCLECNQKYEKMGWKCVTKQHVAYNVSLSVPADQALYATGSGINQFKRNFIANFLPAAYSRSDINSIMSLTDVNYDRTKGIMSISGIVDKLNNVNLVDLNKTIASGFNSTKTIGSFGIINSSVQTYPNTIVDSNTFLNGTGVQNVPVSPQPVNQGPNLAAIIIPSILGPLLLTCCLLSLCYFCKLCCFKKKQETPIVRTNPQPNNFMAIPSQRRMLNPVVPIVNDVVPVAPKVTVPAAVPFVAPPVVTPIPVITPAPIVAPMPTPSVTVVPVVPVNTIKKIPTQQSFKFNSQQTMGSPVNRNQVSINQNLKRINTIETDNLSHAIATNVKQKIDLINGGTQSLRSSGFKGSGVNQVMPLVSNQFDTKTNINNVNTLTNITRRTNQVIDTNINNRIGTTGYTTVLSPVQANSTTNISRAINTNVDTYRTNNINNYRENIVNTDSRYITNTTNNVNRYIDNVNNTYRTSNVNVVNQPQAVTKTDTYTVNTKEVYSNGHILSPSKQVITTDKRYINNYSPSSNSIYSNSHGESRIGRIVRHSFVNGQLVSQVIQPGELFVNNQFAPTKSVRYNTYYDGKQPIDYDNYLKKNQYLTSNYRIKNLAHNTEFIS